MRYNRREILKMVAASGLLGPFFDRAWAGETAGGTNPDLVLWYRNPANKWIDALALGNGRLGAMVFGGTSQERIGLNEDTLWSGGPYDPAPTVEPDLLTQIRELTFAGKLKEAQNLANKLQATPEDISTF